MDRDTVNPDMFEAFAMAFAETLVKSYRERWNRGGVESIVKASMPVVAASRWLKIDEAANRAHCGEKLLYREVRAGRLRAVKVGGRRSLRFRGEWIDEWLQAGAPG